MNREIVKTQLIPPKLGQNVLRRDRLMRMLEHNLDKKLISVTAGAGYGKTTLLAQFVTGLKTPAVFYTISEIDGNLSTFLSYIIAGIRAIDAQFGSRTQGLMERVEDNIEMIIGTFINELLETVGDELFVVLEDYHLIDKIPAINSALEYLLEHIPRNVHLVISSRTSLPFSVAKLSAKANLLELTGNDLRFTSEEIRSLFTEIYKLNMDERILKEIERKSEGWVTVLQLVSYIIERNPGAALNKMIYAPESLDYFASEVFEQQSDNIRSFLIKSCVLEQMAPESCDAILGSSNSNEVLGILVKKNLFISCIDEQKGVFRYHPLFRHFLLNRLAQEKTESIKELHLRAASYFESEKDWTNSINQYLLANDVDNAVRILEREGESFISARRFDVIGDWIAKLPPELLQDRPTLLLYQADLHHWQGQFDKAMQLYKRARTKSMKGGRIEEVVKSISGIASIFLERGLYTEVIKLGEKALDMVKGANPVKAQLLNEIGGAYYYLGDYRRAISVAGKGLKVCERIRNLREEKELVQNLSTCYLMLGEYDKAIEVCNEIINREGPTPEHPVGWTYLNLGLMYALKGEFVHSRRVLQTALRRHRTFNDIRGISMTFRMLGFLNLMMGNYKLSRSYCGRALRFNIRMRDKALNEQALHDISRAYMLEGKLMPAEEYINKIVPNKGASSGKGPFLITKGHINLELGEVESAEMALKLGIEEVRKSQSKDDLMLVHAVLSKLYYKQGEYELTIKHLRSALLLCKEGAYHFILLKLGKIGSSLLEFAMKNGIEPQYAGFLLKEFEPQYALRISFFGGLKIMTTDDKVIAEKWNRQKAKSLFCYLLAHRNKSFTPDQLIEILWPGKSFSKAQSSLWQALSCVRDTLLPFTKQGLPFIERKSGCYGISQAYKVWLDFEEFERLLISAKRSEIAGDERNSISKYEAVTALYNGDFLVEMYEAWSEEKRRFYKGQYLWTIDKISTFHWKGREFKKTIEYCKKAIATDKFHELAYLIAMRSYLALGNRTALLNLYKTLEHTLKEELNTEPSDEIKKLFHKLT